MDVDIHMGIVAHTRLAVIPQICNSNLSFRRMLLPHNFQRLSSYASTDYFKFKCVHATWLKERLQNRFQV